MSRQGSTEVIKVQFAPTVANKAAPTVAELTAGTDLTPFLTRDGLDTPLEGSTIDTAGANSRYNSTGAGTYGGQPITLKMFRDSVAADDDAWSALPFGTTGYLVVRRFGGSSTAFAASQVVEVWPIEVVTRKPLPIADNEAQKFEVSCAVPTPPEMDATVAA